MNLRDRMNSSSPVSKPTENVQMPNLNNTTQNSNPQPQDSMLQKQSEMIQQLQSELNSTTMELDTLKKNGRPQDTERIQTLLSEKSKLTSTIADLRAELSSVQKINQSLTTNNQLLVKQNDDLRNNAGLLSRKEQEKLTADLTTTQARLSDVEKKINMSNVKAVESAQSAQKAAERKATKDIADYKKEADKKISDAVTAKNTAIRQAKDKEKAVKKNQQIAWGTTLITLLCCLIAYPVFSWDVWYFISVPAVWTWEKINNYAYWLEEPSYTKTIMGVEKAAAFSNEWAWICRISTFLLILACIAGSCYVM